MKKYLNILFVFCFLQTQAQTYFNKLINMPNHQYAASVLQMVDGGYFIAGQASKTGMQTLFFMRTDSNGDTLWTKEYGQSGYYYYGGLGALQLTLDNNLIYTGSITYPTLNSQILLVKLNFNGDTLWTKNYGGSFYDAGRDCHPALDGGFVIIADSDSLDNGENDFLLIKTDDNGNEVWQKRYDGGLYAVPLCIKPTFDNGYIISGGKDISASVTSNWIIKVDSIGNLEWSKIYGSGSSDGGCYVTQLMDGNYLTTGTKIISGSNNQGCIRKLDSLGNLIFEKLIGGISYEAFFDKVSESSDSNITVLGQFYNISNKAEAALVKFSSSGIDLWERRYYYNITSNNFPYNFKRTSDNGFIISGQSIGNGGDVWLIKVDSVGCEMANCNVGVEELENEKINFKVYPNPANNYTNIEIQLSESKQGQLSIYNVLGKEVFKQHVKDQDVIIFETDKYANGIYMITLSTVKGKVEKQKLMITK